MQQTIARRGSVLLSVSSLPRQSLQSGLQSPGQGQEEKGEGQSEGRDRSSRATSMISLLGEDRQDMVELVELQDKVKLV